MSAIHAIDENARRVLLEVMIAVAWADRQLLAPEREAVRAATVALGLVAPGDARVTSPDRAPIPPEELDLSGLTERDRELIYLCAAWMAMADEVEQPEETAMLVRVRTQLGLSKERASSLKGQAVGLRQSRPPGHSWWREFDALVVEAARALS